MNSKILTIITFILCLSQLHLTAQTPPLEGLIFNDSAYLNTSYKKMRGKTAPPPGTICLLKDSLEIPEMDQGAIASCVCHTLAQAFYLQQALYLKNNGKGDKKPPLYSASFLFNQLNPGDCDEGISVITALDFFLKQGICPIDTFKNDLHACKPVPGKKENKVASGYRIRNYRRIFLLPEECLKDQNSRSACMEHTRLSTILAIDLGKPVIVGMLISERFPKIKGCKWEIKKNEKLKYGHAVLVVGYDDIKKEFELQNTYGDDWGCNGYFRMSYDDFCKAAVYGFVLYLDKYSFHYHHPLKD